MHVAAIKVSLLTEGLGGHGALLEDFITTIFYVIHQISIEETPYFKDCWSLKANKCSPGSFLIMNLASQTGFLHGKTHIRTPPVLSPNCCPEACRGLVHGIPWWAAQSPRGSLPSQAQRHSLLCLSFRREGEDLPSPVSLLLGLALCSAPDGARWVAGGLCLPPLPPPLALRGGSVPAHHVCPWAAPGPKVRS